VCDSTLLVPPERLDRAQEIFAELQASAKTSDAKPKPLSAQEAADLFKRLKGAISTLSPAVERGGDGAGERVDGSVGVGVFECAVCLDDLVEEQVRILRAVPSRNKKVSRDFIWHIYPGADFFENLRQCKHTFCASCLEHIVAIRHGNKVTCPMCRTDFAEHHVLRASDLEKHLTVALANHSAGGRGGGGEEQERPILKEVQARADRGAIQQREWRGRRTVGYRRRKSRR